MWREANHEHTRSQGANASWGDEIYLSADSDGVFVEHSLLSLEGESATHLNFLSSVGPAYCYGKLPGRQILISDEAHRIVAGKFPKASFLVCQYFRPINLGNLTLELLPSGACPGASFLRIEKKNDSLLFASHWSRKVSASLRKAVFKKANTLLIKLQNDPATVLATNARRETERFLEFAQKIFHAGETLVAVVDSFGEAQDLASRLYEEGLPVFYDAKLATLMKLIHDSVAPAYAPAWLKGIRSKLPEGNTRGVVFVSKQHLVSRTTRSLPSGIWVWMGSDFEQYQHTPAVSKLSFSDIFYVQTAPDMAEIFELVTEVSPSQVLVYGDGAQKCAHHLHGKGVRAEVFAPPKVDTLF